MGCWHWLFLRCWRGGGEWLDKVSAILRLDGPGAGLVQHFFSTATTALAGAGRRWAVHLVRRIEIRNFVTAAADQAIIAELCAAAVA